MTPFLILPTMGERRVSRDIRKSESEMTKYKASMFVNYESVCVDSSHSIGNPVNRRFGDVDIYHWQLANTTAQHGWALAMGNCRTSNDRKTRRYGSICCGDMAYSTVGTVYGTVVTERLALVTVDRIPNCRENSLSLSQPFSCAVHLRCHFRPRDPAAKDAPFG